MANPIVEQLRKTIEAKHAQSLQTALQHLDAMAKYLEELPPDGQEHKLPGKKRSPRAGTGKIRKAVLKAFAQDFASIQMVSDQTKLKRGQVRGVISAPALKSSFSKKEVDGVMHYKFTGQEE